MCSDPIDGVCDVGIAANFSNKPYQSFPFPLYSKIPHSLFYKCYLKY